ncbi:MAG TPA: helix-turn-helix domain-containing protein [Caproicibacter sp.]|nr:helix-turn-helix domain-containing protein [Caproicibacter sp.]
MESFYLCNSEIFGLSHSTAVVYNFLCRVNNVVTGKSFYKRANIAANCHISESSVVRAMRTLCAKGLLEIRRRFDKNGRQTSNDYILIENPQLRLKSDPSPVNESKSVKTKENVPKSPRLFPCRLPSNCNLSSNAIKVYSYLSYRAGIVGQCMPSKKEIASDCSISLSSVWRSLQELIRAGLIKIRHQTRLQTCGNNGTSVNWYILKSVPATEQAQNNKADLPSFCTGKADIDKISEISSAAQSVPKPVTFFSILQHEKCLAFHCLTASFSIFDTHPHFNSDTLKTKSRNKTTINPRERSLLLSPVISCAKWEAERLGRNIVQSEKLQYNIKRDYV